MSQSSKQQQFLSLAMVSHEIRTPMNSVLGFTRLLGESSLSASEQDYVQTIITNTEATLRIVDDILDLACMESGGFRIETQPFVVRSVIADVYNLLALQAREKGIHFKMEIAPDLPEKFVGDAGRLRQVLINLASNAIKFTDTGHVTIAVCGESACLFFSVEDSGIGIPPEKLETIFDPFSGSQKDGGKGLGLAIAQRLVELMSSKLFVESKVGVGSKFYFAMPPLK